MLRRSFAVSRWMLMLALVAAAGHKAAPASETPSSLDEAVRTVRGLTGICVLVGGDASLAANLAEGGHALVHGLLSDAQKVQAARAALLARGLSGRVAVEHWSAPELPYADNLINALVAEESGPVTEAEILRALAPHGTAWIKREGRWVTLRKPWPKEFDEWTHWRHGTDGNMVSRDTAVAAPAGLRWVAGPVQDSGGRKWYYDHVLVSARGRNFYLHDDAISARDAFNGTLLWRRPVKPHLFREVGTDVPDFITQLNPKAKLGVRTSKVRPVALDDRLYVAADGRLTAWDAATGKTLADFGPVTSPREILCDGKKLILSDTNSVRAYDARSRRLLWRQGLNAERLVAGDGALFCLADFVLARLDWDTGQERWRLSDTNIAPATTCVYHEGLVVLETSSWRDDANGCGLRVYSGDNGQLLWEKKHRPDMTHFQETRTFFSQGLLWLQTAGNKVVGLDPRTGAVRQTWRSRGKHCATPVATEQYFIAPECEFTDLATGEQSRARMFKSACRLPFVPANGLLYSFPVQCECFPMLRGYMGLTAAKRPALSRPSRLELGPAYEGAPAAAPSNDAAGDWPMYRHDVYRSGSTDSPVRANKLKRVWSAQVAEPAKAAVSDEWAANPFVKGLITAPVAAGELVLLAVPDEHRVVALDAANGKLRWSFSAGGRIDTPPTIHADRCLFGSHDGWIYSVRVTDGALAWCYRVAPQEARIAAYGQLESPWPVPGSVLVDRGMAFATAGRHPLSDGGVQVVALQPRTGEVIWEKTLGQFALTNWYGMMLSTNQKIGFDFEPVDLLVRDGSSIAMSRWQFNPAQGDFALSLASLTYQAPGLAVPRGLWGYGIRQTKSVLNKPPAAFNQNATHTGTTNDVALLLAAGTLVAASSDGTLRCGAHVLKLDAPAVHDGLAVARGHLYVSTRAGKLHCFE